MSRLEATPQKTAPVSDELLRGLAVQAFNMAKRDVERDCFNFLVASYTRAKASTAWQWWNAKSSKGSAKTGSTTAARRQSASRSLVSASTSHRPNAVIIGTAINRFKATAKLRARPVTDRRRCSTRNHDRHHEAVAEGLLEVCNALFVSVQTPEKMLLYTQDFNRGGARGAPDVQLSAQTSSMAG